MRKTRGGWERERERKRGEKDKEGEREGERQKERNMEREKNNFGSLSLVDLFIWI